jgi:nitrate reductase gamma subunit
VNAFVALVIILLLSLVAAVSAGISGLTWFFLAIFPYVAFVIFLAGFLYRVILWSRAPVPFHIPTVAGQQKSFNWIRSNRLESPSSSSGLFGRMFMEIVFFRSLWRNDRVELKNGGKLVFGSNRYLWMGAVFFHWSLAIILFRHLRFFTDPVMVGVTYVQSLDGFFQIAAMSLYLTDIFIVLGLGFLLLRRFFSAQVTFVSLMQDYFALFLLTAIVLSGILMRYFVHPDLVGIKDLILGLVTFHPLIPSGEANWLVPTHLVLVSVLLAYFPFSKLMHAPGIFLSPTRNLRNDSRAKRHVNPLNHPVKIHSYEEWEDDFRSAMIEAGLPVEKND